MPYIKRPFDGSFSFRFVRSDLLVVIVIFYSFGILGIGLPTNRIFKRGMYSFIFNIFLNVIGRPKLFLVGFSTFLRLED